MTSETKQRFLDLMDEVLVALGCDSWEIAVQSVREKLDRLVGSGFLDIPLREFLTAIDTREKMTGFLDVMPEPDSALVDFLVKKAVPNARKAIIEIGMKLPADQGGRHRKFPTKEDRDKVRSMIKRLIYEDDYTLREAQLWVARREKAGLSTVQRVWREGRRRLPERSGP